jgi:hypothetical protein
MVVTIAYLLYVTYYFIKIFFFCPLPLLRVISLSKWKGKYSKIALLPFKAQSHLPQPILLSWYPDNTPAFHMNAMGRLLTAKFAMTFD